MSATLADIARATNTSISTVSRVLTGAPAAQRMSEQTRKKVSAAAVELGYRPNLLARSLRTRRTHTVAVMVSDIANPWFGQLASLIERSLHRHGYSLMVCNSGEDARLEEEYLQLLPQKGIDGLIIIPLATVREQLMRYFPAGTPIVVVDRPVEGVQACITTDQRQASTILCDQLEKVGVRRVALVRGPHHIFTHRQRSEMVRERFEVVADDEGPAQRETGKAAWPAILKSKPDAVVCTNNFLGEGVIEEMSGGRFRPPVACYDLLPLMQLLTVPVVCSVQDIPKLSEGAVQMLLGQIEGTSSTPAAGKVVRARIVCNEAFTELSRAK